MDGAARAVAGPNHQTALSIAGDASLRSLAAAAVGNALYRSSIALKKILTN